MSEAVTVEVWELLNAQVAAWNRGDLDGFMEGYWRSPQLTFFSGGVESRDWDSARENYRRRYQSEGREMGKLGFVVLDVKGLGGDAAVARGRWRLQAGDNEAGGLFTLILERFADGWKIIHDHTSE